MNVAITQSNKFLIYGVPLAVILSSVFLALSPLLSKNPELALGIVSGHR